LFTLLQEENKQFKSENTLLKNEVKELNKIMCNLEESHGENTNKLVKWISELVGAEVGQTDISLSHRLLSKRDQIPTIIAKSTKQYKR
jgi:primosomal protein N''